MTHNRLGHVHLRFNLPSQVLMKLPDAPTQPAAVILNCLLEVTAMPNPLSDPPGDAYKQPDRSGRR